MGAGAMLRGHSRLIMRRIGAGKERVATGRIYGGKTLPTGVAPAGTVGLQVVWQRRGEPTNRRSRLRPEKAYLLTVALSWAPGLKRTLFDAGMVISSPVAGLRPLPAARVLTENVPKPTRRTSSPLFSAWVIAPITASSASPAAALEVSVASATASINSALL